MGKAKERGPSGLLVIDKPLGMTSHDVVSKTRWIVGTRKVGHAGTLDPQASGVLLVGLNKATKLLTYLVGQDKTYEATIVLGAATVTEDAEGELISVAPASPVRALFPDAEGAQERVLAAMAALSGEIDQVPSAVSAIKVNGVRSYARVRAGENVELAARPVTISEFELLDMRRGMLTTDDYGVAESADTKNLSMCPDSGQVPARIDTVELDVRVSCSSGTYIRALARDLGAALGVGAHLKALNRSRVGAIYQAEATALDTLVRAREESGQPLDLFPHMPLETLAKRLFAVRELSAAEATDISFGRGIEPVDGEPVTTSDQTEGSHASTRGLSAAFAPDGTLVALLRTKKVPARAGGGVKAVPELVFEAGKSFS
ncbi:MAG: tRNA pseudouridine(55) synthase TruB [Rothia sp. (in: high G+C Gram-positive bacteria)]|uniref:tRNA pseudouridine(55) synthase TruB n=1 Tax=Rothia sp. (in: high G+C Gram-positive bacteria) TaxID=1885016 RepID=UPI0026DEF82D|nr:tRNA pseudouridine(55) synthase TruB [Rothia sp. (in: high G+C Gram-positive bacteria)]MDO5750388.1 tRNA pseudouridine(55) synthase TruB [Rothia sp. (in: high G+C Gram-positive bacteria)]